MIFCNRCGVDVLTEGLCADCREAGRRRGPRFDPEHRAVVYAEIREYAAMGIRRSEIARNFGVHHSEVDYVLGKARVVA